MSKFYGGCDAGSTYTKCVILNEDGKWLKIAYYINGKRIEGYVSSSYVKIG